MTILAAVLAGASAHAQQAGGVDRMEVRPHEGQFQLVWRDAEDVLEGAVLPSRLEAGQPVTVSVRVRSFEGPAFDGPVTVTLRSAGEQHGPSVVVNRDGERWLAELTPETAGPHVVSVGFRTTRHKVVHGEVTVYPAPLPRMLLWVVVGVLILAVVGVGASRVLRRGEGDPVGKSPGVGG